MANPALALKAIKLGVKGIKKVVKKNKAMKKVQGGPDHNLGHMVRKNRSQYGGRELAGSPRYKYAEKEPDFSLFKNPPGKKGPKRKSGFKIEKSKRGGFQKPILKGGQLIAKKHDDKVKATAKKYRDARREAKLKNKNIVKKVKAPKGATRQDLIPDSNPNEYGYGTDQIYQPYRNLKKRKK